MKEILTVAEKGVNESLAELTPSIEPGGPCPRIPKSIARRRAGRGRGGDRDTEMERARPRAFTRPARYRLRRQR
jgi:hypothetical protein